jgi:hypothetical protein
MGYLAHHEPHWHLVEEGRFELHPPLLEIRPDVKYQLVAAQPEMLALEQSPGSASILIGLAAQQMMRVVAMQYQQIEPQTLSGLAVHGIEHVRGEPSTGRH